MLEATIGTENTEKRIKEKYGRQDVYIKAYADLVYALPSPDEASQ